MNTLTDQLRRLFALADHSIPEALADVTEVDLVGPDGCARTLVLEVRGTDWPALAAAYRGVQVDLGLPAPLVAVVPGAGFQLWFSLAVPVPLEQARRFLDGLRREYLGDSPSLSRPGPDGHGVAVVPALHRPSGKWSAFIDPTLGEMFVDDPGLDMAPGFERQADMLAGAASMPLADFLRVVGMPSPTDFAPPGNALSQGAAIPARRFDDPRDFLLAAMNDSTLSMTDRIEAAKALLPYYPMKGNTDGIA